MRILLISNMYPANKHDTYGVFIRNIEEGLVQNGVEVDKIVIKGRGVGVIEKATKYILFYRDIIRKNFEEYDFIHLSYPSHTYPAVIFKSFNKAKLIVRLHGHDLIPVSLYHKLVNNFTRLSIAKADMVVIPSIFFYNELVKTQIPKKYHIYPSGGLDTHRFYPKPRESNERLIIGYVGRVDRGKGVETLIDAVIRLEFKYKLIIVGGGELEDELKHLSTNLQKKQLIQFTGRIPNDNLIDYYNMFDIFVFPTLMKESFGNVAIEAMGCKVPIIGSRLGGLTDYIIEGENGYFFKAGDTKELCMKISKYFNLSADDKRRMSNNAYQIALQYEKNHVSNEFIKKLERL